MDVEGVRAMHRDGGRRDGVRRLAEAVPEGAAGIVAGVAVPTAAFLGVAALTGLGGGSSYTRALRLLGGPLGMPGGVGVLALGGVVADRVTDACVGAARERARGEAGAADAAPAEA